MHKVSVIVPVFNAENTIEQCIDSIRRNNYPEMEIIIIDDGSTDRSAELCDILCNQDKRLISYHISNHGPSYARNYGMKHATGEYLIFVDADDTIASDTIEVCMTEIKDCDMCIFNLSDIKDSVCTEKRIFKKSRLLFRGYDEIDTLRINAIEDMTDFGHGAISLTGAVCKMYRTESIKDCFFPEQIRSGEDCCFLLQALDASHKIVYINKVMYYRNINDNSLTHKHNDKFLDQRLLYINWVLEYFHNDKKNRFNSLNEFCFVNFRIVAEYIFECSDLNLLEKTKKIRGFFDGIPFEKKFAKVKIREKNRNKYILEYILSRFGIYPYLLVLELRRKMVMKG